MQEENRDITTAILEMQLLVSSVENLTTGVIVQYLEIRYSVDTPRFNFLFE